MNIEQLKLLSNLEINRLCAVNIMGWEVITEHEDLGNRRQRSNYEVGGIIALYGKRWMARRQGKSSYWNPSEDMNDALLLLDNFKIHQLTKSNTGFSHSKLSYRAIVGKNQNVAYDDVATLAACYACLLAEIEERP